MNYLKISYRLMVYLTSFTVCSGDYQRKKKAENDQSKKKALKMTSQLVLFRAYFFFFVPQNLI